MSTETLDDVAEATADGPARTPLTAGAVLRAARDRVRRQPVLWTAAALIAVQLGFRAWALAGGWFLIDDYAFLSDAVDQPLTVDYLFQPHNDHLQPFGFLFAWVTAQTGPFNWGFSTVVSVCVQAVASTAALVFLVRLLGRRWVVLVPLGFYLFSVITLPGYLWWCVVMLQVPLQAAAFTAMALHLEYLRTRRTRWLVLTTVALAVGMLADVKVAFVGVGLAFLSLYLNDGATWRRRVADAVWGQRWAWLTYGVVFGAYLTLYLSINPLGGRESTARWPVFEVMFRHTLGPVVGGGPWEWGPMADTPLVPAQSPEWTITLVWVVMALLVAQAVRRYRPVAWVLVPLLACVVVNVIMVSTARGAIFGSTLGLEVRYLGDLAPTLTLVIAVLASGLLARNGPPQVAAVPAGWSRRPARLAVVACVLLAVGGAVVSNLRYVSGWHSDYPAREFTQNVIRQSEEQPIRVIDRPVPLTVIPSDEIVNTFGVPSRIFKPLGGRVTAVLEGNDLDVLDDRGIVHPAGVSGRAQTAIGPDDDCGYQVDATTTTEARLYPVPGTDALGDVWWASIGYLASQDGVVEVSIGDTDTRMSVQRGLHTYLFLGSGPVELVELDAVTDTVVCVDQVLLGELAPLDLEEGGS